MADKTSVPSSGATDAFRGVAFFSASSIIVACFVLQALPLGILGRTLGVASAAAYRTGFFAAAAAHGYRVAYTMRPKLAAAVSTGLQAAGPALARELLSSNSFLYTLYCVLFLMSRPTALAMVPVAFTALLQALTYLARSSSPPARRTALTLRAAPPSRRSRAAPQTKNPPASALWQTYGVRAYDMLQASLPVALGMCATMQVMIGITMLFSLLSSNREVVSARPCVPSAQRDCTAKPCG